MTQTKENRERANAVPTEVIKFKQEYEMRIEEMRNLYHFSNPSKLQVSMRTARWVELYLQTIQLWGDISDLCECDGDLNIDNVAENELLPTLGTLQDFLLNRVKNSIMEHITSINTTTL